MSAHTTPHPDLFALFGVAAPARGRSDERLSVERAVTLAELEAAKAASALPVADMQVQVHVDLDDTSDGPATARKRKGKRKPVTDLDALRASRGAVIRTYHDHRFAMSFGILGSHDLHGDGRPWLTIDDPGCCAKTFPHFFDVLADLRTRAR